MTDARSGLVGSWRLTGPTGNILANDGSAGEVKRCQRELCDV